MIVKTLEATPISINKEALQIMAALLNSKGDQGYNCKPSMTTLALALV